MIAKHPFLPLVTRAAEGCAAAPLFRLLPASNRHVERVFEASRQGHRRLCFAESSRWTYFRKTTA
jgi:hypothetical protein